MEPTVSASAAATGVPRPLRAIQDMDLALLMCRLSLEAPLLKSERLNQLVGEAVLFEATARALNPNGIARLAAHGVLRALKAGAEGLGDE